MDLDAQSRAERGRSALNLVLPHEARRDLFAISLWTEAHFGRARAQRYLHFLRQEAERIAEVPGLGRAVTERPGFLYVTARRRQGGHGHILVYTVEGEDVYLTNIFHTAQDWRAKLEEP